jgi:hypothetical protein
MLVGMRVLSLGLLVVAGMLAQEANQVQHSIQVKTGPDVGSAVPHFEAPDQNGRIQTLDTVAGPQGTLLVFYRSADW